MSNSTSVDPSKLAHLAGFEDTNTNTNTNTQSSAAPTDNPPDLDRLE